MVFWEQLVISYPIFKSENSRNNKINKQMFSIYKIERLINACKCAFGLILISKQLVELLVNWILFSVPTNSFTMLTQQRAIKDKTPSINVIKYTYKVVCLLKRQKFPYNKQTPFVNYRVHKYPCDELVLTINYSKTMLYVRIQCDILILNCQLSL